MFKTIDVDISDSVFEGERPAIMYITKEKDTETYIISIPSVCYSWYVAGEEDYESLLDLNFFESSNQRENLVKVIRSNINHLN